MTKIVHIQFSTESAGGAAIRLQRAFINKGLQSTIVSLIRDVPAVENVKYLGKKEIIIAKIDVKLQSFFIKKTPKKFGLFSYSILGNDISEVEEIKNADIIYVHWVLNGFLSLKNLKQLAKMNKPVIIFMHDMWSITGGCHYSFTCENYKTGCYNCQMFPESKKSGLPARNFQKKLKLYWQYSNFYFVTPSKWLYECARQSLVTKNKELFYIPNLLDNTIFKPCDTEIARKILNINTDETVLAFGAVSIQSPYKGWSYLEQSLQILKEQNNLKNVCVLIFGSGYNNQIAEAIPFKTRFMGYLCDEYSTSLVYNAADVFIAPSLADNQPTTVQESLSCGTPVVGFDVGGIPDMIKHMENGYLAKYKDAGDIAKGIVYCLQHNIKGYMLPEFAPGVTVKRHLELFEYISNKNKNNNL